MSLLSLVTMSSFSFCGFCPRKMDVLAGTEKLATDLPEQCGLPMTAVGQEHLLWGSPLPCAGHTRLGDGKSEAQERKMTCLGCLNFF